jgi:hypothetical protein
MPLGTKSRSITIEHGQPHECNTIGCYGSNDILFTIWHNRWLRAINTWCENIVFHNIGWHCKTWTIGCMPSKMSLARTKCYHS